MDIAITLCFLFQLLIANCAPSPPSFTAATHVTPHCKTTDFIVSVCILDCQDILKEIESDCEKEPINATKVLENTNKILPLFNAIYKISANEYSSIWDELYSPRTVKDMNDAFDILPKIGTACYKNTLSMKRVLKCLKSAKLDDQNTHKKFQSQRTKFEEAIQNCDNLQKKAKNLVSSARIERKNNWQDEKNARLLNAKEKIEMAIEKEKMEAKESLKALQEEIQILETMEKDEILPKQTKLRKLFDETINLAVISPPLLTEEQEFINLLIKHKQLAIKLRQKVELHHKSISQHEEHLPGFENLVMRLQTSLEQNNKYLEQVIKDNIEQVLIKVVEGYENSIIPNINKVDEAEYIIAELKSLKIKVNAISDSLKDKQKNPTKVAEDYLLLKNSLQKLKEKLKDEIGMAVIKIKQLKEGKNVKNDLPDIEQEIRKLENEEVGTKVELAKEDKATAHKQALKVPFTMANLSTEIRNTEHLVEFRKRLADLLSRLKSLEIAENVKSKKEQLNNQLKTLLKNNFDLLNETVRNNVLSLMKGIKEANQNKIPNVTELTELQLIEQGLQGNVNTVNTFSHLLAKIEGKGDDRYETLKWSVSDMKKHLSTLLEKIKEKQQQLNTPKKKRKFDLIHFLKQYVGNVKEEVNELEKTLKAHKEDVEKMRENHKRTLKEITDVAEAIKDLNKQAISLQEDILALKKPSHSNTNSSTDQTSQETEEHEEESSPRRNPLYDHHHDTHFLNRSV